jgi:hypothetical protein
MRQYRIAEPPRCIALLPDGERLTLGTGETGAEFAVCQGPDELGRCPAVVAGEDRPCAQADWYVLDEIGRPYFAFESSAIPRLICPLTRLDSIAAARVGRDVSRVVARAGAD